MLQPQTVLGVDCPATPRRGVDVIILCDMTITSRIVSNENLSDTIYIHIIITIIMIARISIDIFASALVLLLFSSTRFYYIEIDLFSKFKRYEIHRHSNGDVFWKNSHSPSVCFKVFTHKKVKNVVKILNRVTIKYSRILYNGNRIQYIK